MLHCKLRLIPTLRATPLRARISSMATPPSGAKPVVSFVTGNKKKLEEVVQILQDGVELPVRIDNVALDLPEHQVTPLASLKRQARVTTRATPWR